MKILSLDLIAFGPFTDVVLDLSEGSEGLHLVYGPNEAGKSSALRALQQALFEIPVISPDNFVYPYPKMRIGLTLRGADGRELRFVRRKGNRDTLLAADGTTPLPVDALSRFLNGLSEKEFTTRFALGHDELVRGGKSILEGGGELGGLLFQAGSGLKNLLDVQRELRKEIEALYKPGGSKPVINAGLGELKEAKDTYRTKSLKSGEWVEQDTAYRRADERLVEVERRLSEAHAEGRRLERLKEALPLLLRQRKTEEELAELGDVAVLPEAFTQARTEALARLEQARGAEERAAESIAELDRQVAVLFVPEALLSESEAIERIRTGLAAERKARKARTAEEGKLQQILDDARELLADLKPDLLRGLARETGPTSFDALLGAAEVLRLTRAQHSTIQDLSQKLASLIDMHDRALEDVARQTEELASEQAVLARLEPPGETEPLDLALRQARDQGDLDGSLETARKRLAQLDRQAARALARLNLWTGTLEELETARVPAVETVDRFETDWTQLEADRKQLEGERKTAEDQRADAEANLQRLRQTSGQIPTAEDLTAARDRRDRIWRMVRRAWETGALPNAEEFEDINAVSPISASSLAEAYEQAVAHVDAQADRMWREADRIAQQAGAHAELSRSEQRLDSLERQEDRHRERLDDFQTRWAEAWRSTAIDPLSPREMRAWLVTRQELLKQGIELHEARDEVARLGGRLQAHQAALARGLVHLGEPAVDVATGSLASMRDRAEEVLEKIRSIEARRSKIVENIAALQRRIVAERARSTSSAESLDEWRCKWAAAVAPLGLPPEVSTDQATRTTDLAKELQAKVKDARASRARIEDMERDSARFALAVHDLYRRVAPDLLPGDAAQTADSHGIELAAEELLRMDREAEKAGNRRQGLLTSREAAEAAALEAQTSFQEATALLAALCREARCRQADELPEAERQSRTAVALRERLQADGERLLALTGHEPSEAFRKASLALDVDRLPEQLAALNREIQTLDAERGELNQEMGRLRQILRQMDGGAEAAGAIETAEAVKAKLALEIDEYARLSLGAVVLREAIERYRRKSQGPVIDRASEIFSALTLGSFEGLRVDFDDRDQPALRARRGVGKESVALEGLSLGTADQLYLALRLASLQTYLESHEPIPLVVDDVLIQFDDERAAAALNILARLSCRTQIVMFTHHEHVCRLAEASVEPHLLFLHELPGRVPMDSVVRKA